MIRRPTRSTRTDTLFPYTTLFRSGRPALHDAGIGRAGDLMPAPAHDEEPVLPPGFEDLLEFVPHWIGETAKERWDIRAREHMPELTRFHYVLPPPTEAIPPPLQNYPPPRLQAPHSPRLLLNT